MIWLILGLELLELAALVGAAVCLWQGPRRRETEVREEDEEDVGDDDRRLRQGIVNLMSYSVGEKKEEG